MNVAPVSGNCRSLKTEQSSPVQTEEDCLESLFSALFRFFQKRKTGAFVFRDFISGRESIKCSVSGCASEVVQGDFLPAFEFLQTTVEEVGFAGFFALYAECHNDLFFRDGGYFSGAVAGVRPARLF